MLAIAAGSLVIVLLSAQLLPASAHGLAGGVVLGAVGLFLAYRFGVARDSSYHGFEFDKLIPDPRAGFRNDGAGVAMWAIGVEGLKIAAVCMASALASGVAASSTGLLAAILVVIVLRGAVPRYYWRLSPSLGYAVMLLACILAGLVSVVPSS